jgi:hypothetical protein
MASRADSAPDILENAGIAWPNPAMWLESPHSACAISPPKLTVDPLDVDLHSHSPRRQSSSSAAAANPYGSMPPPTVFRAPSNTSRPRAAATAWAEIQDPFLEPGRGLPSQGSCRSLLDEVNALDSSSLSAGSSSRYPSIEHAFGPGPGGEEEEEGAASLDGFLLPIDSPTGHGVVPPNNTRANNTPVPESSAAAPGRRPSTDPASLPPASPAHDAGARREAKKTPRPACPPKTVARRASRASLPARSSSTRENGLQQASSGAAGAPRGFSSGDKRKRTP